MIVEIYILFSILSFLFFVLAIERKRYIYYFLNLVFCGILIVGSFVITKTFCGVSTTLICQDKQYQYTFLAYFYFGFLLLNLVLGILEYLETMKKAIKI